LCAIASSRSLLSVLSLSIANSFVYQSIGCHVTVSLAPVHFARLIPLELMFDLNLESSSSPPPTLFRAHVCVFLLFPPHFHHSFPAATTFPLLATKLFVGYYTHIHVVHTYIPNTKLGNQSLFLFSQEVFHCGWL